MKPIQVLDCTLRDGGYCNGWRFGYNNMRKITECLRTAKIDIIECGFITNRVSDDKEISKFTSIEQVNDILPSKKDECTYVVMMNYGEFDVETLPECSPDGVTGIRLAFHKKNYEDAIQLCKAIKEKGYKVFVQPMVSLCYSDEEFLHLINLVNELSPYAFYIVDSFGMMKRTDLRRLFYLVEHNLKDEIIIGYHSHNNLQLAYSNAQSLVEMQTRRNIIIDSSIYGMGRGAGNLNTELFVDYLNDVIRSEYDMKPILHVIDEVLKRFYDEEPWGYSLPNYLSAYHNIHPNYANYLNGLNTLTVEAMDEIFSSMETDKAYEFDQKYIEEKYLEFMARGQVMDQHLEEFREVIAGKTIVVIGPGKSAVANGEYIKNFIKDHDALTISVNFDYSIVTTDYIFVSNLRRFRELPEASRSRSIVTSNIKTSNAYMGVDYQSLLNEVDLVRDNAGMMLISFLIQLGVEKIHLAGFDGFSSNIRANYGSDSMRQNWSENRIDEVNRGISKVLEDFSKRIKIEWLTTSIYEEE